MSTIVSQVEAKITEIGTALSEAIASKPLSRAMRAETWGDHYRAEYSPFEQALVKGQLSKAGYADLLLQVWFVYDALERAAERLKDDPIAGQFHITELHRKLAVEADLEFYVGAKWRDQLEALACTVEYVQRIDQATPIQFVAHHYTRYLADLSGGMFIDMAIKDAYGLDMDGRRYYQFTEIDSPTEFKNAYRGTLDALAITPEQKEQLCHEVMLAYEFNIAMGTELGTKHLVAA